MELKKRKRVELKEQAVGGKKAKLAEKEKKEWKKEKKTIKPSRSKSNRTDY